MKFNGIKIKNIHMKYEGLYSFGGKNNNGKMLRHLRILTCKNYFNRYLNLIFKKNY